MPEPSTSTSAPPTAAGPEFTASMLSSCVAGTSVVFLSSLTAEDARAHGPWLLNFETSRLASLATRTAGLPVHPVHMGLRDQVCKTAMDSHSTNKAFEVFLWIGPLPTADAGALCGLLGKPASWDCHVVPAA
ncbi:hypothetical protein ACWGE0_26605 [Lentzea sp. NPDC054927]